MDEYLNPEGLHVIQRVLLKAFVGRWLELKNTYNGVICVLNYL